MAKQFNVAEDMAYTCESAGYFWLLHVLSRWERFQSEAQRVKTAECVKVSRQPSVMPLAIGSYSNTFSEDTAAFVWAINAFSTSDWWVWALEAVITTTWTLSTLLRGSKRQSGSAQQGISLPCDDSQPFPHPPTLPWLTLKVCQR